MRHTSTIRHILSASLAAAMAASVVLSGCDSGSEEDKCAQRFEDASPASSVESPDDYISGVERVSDAGLFLVELRRSTPTPKFTGDYTWELVVADATCGEVLDVEVHAEPTMPQHGHGTTPQFTEATPDTAGIYTLTDMSLFMAWVWQIEITVTAEDGAEDTVSWFFDLEG